LIAPTTREAVLPITDVMAVVTVADFEAGCDWYEQLFGRPADARQLICGAQFR